MNINQFYFFEYCQKEGIKKEFTITYTPQQNDISKRKNKTLIEVVLAMLTFAKLPKSLKQPDDCKLFGKLTP
jgi:hypothetical protein